MQKAVSRPKESLGLSLLYQTSTGAENRNVSDILHKTQQQKQNATNGNNTT
jgi:hypothetical protein